MTPKHYRAVLVAGVIGAVAALWTACAWAQPSRSYESLGAGVGSCGVWTQDRATSHGAWSEDLEWVLGYLSAYDRFVARNGMVAKHTDSAGVTAWLDTYCTAHPLDEMHRAADALVQDLKRQN
ncbi:MAG: hypothetical protein ACHP7N_08955 [Caulobacterales bacterium]